MVNESEVRAKNIKKMHKVFALLYALVIISVFFLVCLTIRFGD